MQLVQRVCNKVQLISILLTFPGQCIDFSPKAKRLLTHEYLLNQTAMLGTNFI